MSKKNHLNLDCPLCSSKVQATIYSSIHGEDPNEIRLIKEDKLNRVICQSCHIPVPISMSVMYHKSRENFALWYEPKPDPMIDNGKAGIKNMLGEAGNYMINAERVKDWHIFKKKVLDFENKLVNRKKEAQKNITNLAEFLIYHCTHTVKVRIGSLRCQKCMNIDLFSMMRGDCGACHSPIPYYRDNQIFLLSLMVYKEFLDHFDERLNHSDKNKILNNLSSHIAIFNSKGRTPTIEKIKNEIINPILKVKSLGGEKVGGTVVFNGDQQPNLNIATKNGLVKGTAAPNLSAVILAFEFIRKYGHNPVVKRWWEFWK